MLSTLSGRIILLITISLIALLQYKLWWGESGFDDRQELKQRIEQQHAENLKLAERNRILSAEVFDLKNGIEAVEEHARLDLGLIKPHETFVQLSTVKPDQLHDPASALSDQELSPDESH